MGRSLALVAALVVALGLWTIETASSIRVHGGV